MSQCLLDDRAILRLSGPDTRPFLQGLLTQDVDRLAPDSVLYAGLLSPQGKTLFALFLFSRGEDVLLDVAANQAEALAKRLTMFRMRKQVTISPEPDLAVWQAWGADAGLPVDPRTPLAGSRHVGRLGTIPSPTATLDLWHGQRLALGLPSADEIGSDDLLWLETNARELNGVSFTKGCYTGQENTARMHHRDKLRKRLLPVRLSGPSTAGAKLMAGDRAAGELRGVRHGDLQMALFRMEYLDQRLSVDGAPADVLRPPWLEVEAAEG
jgi:folate-binding protein YgfZ